MGSAGTLPTRAKTASTADSAPLEPHDATIDTECLVTAQHDQVPRIANLGVNNEGYSGCSVKVEADYC